MVSWCQIWLSRGHSSSLLLALPVVEEILTRLFVHNAAILSVVKVDVRLAFYNTYEEILSMCLNASDPRDLEVVSRLTTSLMRWGLQSELYLPPHYFEDDSMQCVRRHILYQYLKLGFDPVIPLVDAGAHYERCLQVTSARWMVIKGPLRGHNDTPCGWPTPGG
jgi:hypothetical protein